MPGMETPLLELRAVEKRFVTSQGEELRALVSINLSVQANEFVCIVGPSGCGKSTLLRMIAGLESCPSGSITFRGQKKNENLVSAQSRLRQN